MKYLKYFFIIVFVFSTTLTAQRMLKISVQVNGQKEYLSYLNRKGMTYVSSRELAKILSGNFYYNNDAAKIELKFSNYNLKVTARNQFVILVDRETKEQNVFQIPISTMLISDDVFIPLAYTLPYINLAYEKELRFDDADKNLIVTNKDVNTVAAVKDEPQIITKPVEKKVSEEKVDSKYDIYGINIDEKSNGTLVRLKSQKKIPIPRSSISNNVLYVYLYGASVDPNLAKYVKPSGLVKNVNVRNISKDNTQLEFTLKAGYSTQETFQDIENDDLLVTIHNKLFTAGETNFEANKEKWQFDVIVIDAGHGGKDPGAIGVTGVREKNVNLGVALKLGSLIEQKMKDVNVVYTRKTDKFVELYKRGKIANENGGKLFISIHCNSLPHKPSQTRGFEVYLLRPGRTKEAISIAEYENSVIKYENNPERYKQLTDENFILVSMAHSAYMRYSEKFSDILSKDWDRYTDIPSRGIKQAGFYVLVGASMPGVLIETGFLTNRRDEAYLNSSKGQSEIAKGIFEAIKSYKTYYTETVEEEG